ncbi:TetR/AcrR family transcriptional regulator [Kribbella turkmenica]|nr:TetR/AcrR family transcriptional regulator [Kribbella turkmenica]
MPRNGSHTRARLLDAAELLVERNGFAATSVDAILEEAGSSKGAFFHHFSSKRELTQALVARYVDTDLGMLQQGLDAAADVDDPAEKVLAFLSFYEKWADELVTADSACLYIALVTEQNLLDEVSSAEIRRAVAGWREGFAALLRPALERCGVGSAEIDVEELADHLFATFEGGYMLCRALGSPDPMRVQLRVYRQLVDRLIQGRPTP